MIRYDLPIVGIGKRSGEAVKRLIATTGRMLFPGNVNMGPAPLDVDTWGEKLIEFDLSRRG